MFPKTEVSFQRWNKFPKSRQVSKVDRQTLLASRYIWKEFFHFLFIISQELSMAKPQTSGRRTAETIQ